MIKLSYSEIVSKIKEKSDLSESEIEQRVKDKMKQLSGLISKEGAAHIIANELGVKVLESLSGKVKIKDIHSGMRNLEVYGKVLKKYELREFKRNERSGKVANFLIGDETGTTKVVLWNDLTDKFSLFKEGDIVKIENALARDNNERVELHLNSVSLLVVNPPGISITVKPMEQSSAQTTAKGLRKSIKELAENDTNIELLATIVQVYDPKFFELCPECNARAKSTENGFACATHGIVAPKYGYVLNMHLDDGTDNVRAVLWRAQILELVNMPEQDFLKFRESPFEFEGKKTELLGNIVKTVGKVNKNQTFNNTEFVVQSISLHPDPEKEIERLMPKQDKPEVKPEIKTAPKKP
ncbi:MAG: OB-fold nucleic acid binding domain-containing protein, partial [Candidatus Woesearchaeota archaeon]